MAKYSTRSKRCHRERNTSRGNKGTFISCKVGGGRRPVSRRPLSRMGELRSGPGWPGAGFAAKGRRAGGRRAGKWTQETFQHLYQHHLPALEGAYERASKREQERILALDDAILSPEASQKAYTAFIAWAQTVVPGFGKEGPQEYARHPDLVTSAGCRKLEKDLDAYGHLTYVVGWSDEWNEDVPEDSDRGDWLATTDYNIGWVDGKLMVAYHVVVNSDSGGFIDTLESGCVPVEDAPFDLLDYWNDVGADQISETTQGRWFTKQELKDNQRNIKRWSKDLRGAIASARKSGRSARRGR